MGPRSDITVAFESPCDAEHRCGRCEDCELADEIDDDAPSADEPDESYYRAHSAARLSGDAL